MGAGSLAEAAVSGSSEPAAARSRRPLRKPKMYVERPFPAATLAGDADVAELVDAHCSGPCGRKPVEVQVLSSALV